MNADEFRDYILGFIFYKYLSERMNLFANEILKEDGITYDTIDETTEEGQAYLDAIKEEALEQIIAVEASKARKKDKEKGKDKK